MQVSAVVVARKGSKRIPNKALQPFGDELLVSHKVKQLLHSKQIDRVIVGSDCDEILQIGRAAGAETVKRPDFYCNEQIASANDMISNMCSLIETDIVVWAHCTNPLLQACTYDLAVETFLSKRAEGFDSLLSVDLVQEHLWEGSEFKPMNYNPYAERHPLAKELPPLYKQNGGIFIQPHHQMLENRYFFGDKPYLFQTPLEESYDINTFHDLAVARALWSRQFDSPENSDNYIADKTG